MAATVISRALGDLPCTSHFCVNYVMCQHCNNCMGSPRLVYICVAYQSYKCFNNVCT